MAADGDIHCGAKPLRLIAELTHRCPLGCPYCSNPLALEQRENELDTAAWMRVFVEAAALGVRQVDLSGGEPGARRDLVEIAASAREAGLCANLVTSGVGITTRTMRDLWEAGLEHVQLSFQDSDAVAADHIAGHKGAFQVKHAVATEAVRLGLKLAVNVVVHRANIGRIGAMVELALALKAHRIEIARVRYHGWALKNRRLLQPTRAQIERANAEIEGLRRRHQDRIVIDVLAPDRCACRSGAPGSAHTCVIHVMPSGHALPCPAADSNPELEFWNVREHSLAEIWRLSPAFNAFRGSFCPLLHCDSAACAAEIHVYGPYDYRR